MFERYTEEARRALFFARYESSQYGALAIAPEHLLFGILRETGPLLERILSTVPETIEAIRKSVADRIQRQEQVPTSVEIPFSTATKRVLQYGAEESDRLLDNYIGPEHLLLGLLREGDSVAASVLGDHGLQLDEVRQRVAGLSSVQRSHAPAGYGVERVVFVQQTAAFDEYVGLIKARVQQLAAADNAEHRYQLAEEIQTALDSLRDRL
jgi:ATP-dependent Clp protease ATP-binding subunit ClpC